MSTYPIPELLQRWARGELTAEQALGHTLQHLLELSQRVDELETALRRLGHLPPADPDA
jgi:hypothetical protein